MGLNEQQADSLYEYEVQLLGTRYKLQRRVCIVSSGQVAGLTAMAKVAVL